MRSEGALQRLQEVADRVRPTALAREQVLPVHDALGSLLPNGLVRGTTVQVTGTANQAGSTSLALALLAGPSAGGSWVAAVGIPTLGLAAAAGFGVDLGRLVLVAPPPPGEWATVVATLLDAFEVVVVRPPHRATGRSRCGLAMPAGSPPGPASAVRSSFALPRARAAP